VGRNWRGLRSQRHHRFVYGTVLEEQYLRSGNEWIGW
jgi:hypothetical protein